MRKSQDVDTAALEEALNVMAACVEGAASLIDRQDSGVSSGLVHQFQRVKGLLEPLFAPSTGAAKAAHRGKS